MSALMERLRAWLSRHELLAAAQAVRHPMRTWRRRREEMTAPPWRPLGVSTLSVRAYHSYEEYVNHQASKLHERRSEIEKYDESTYLGVASRIDKLECAGKRVLCLAARLGGEVRAFIDAGAFAIGVDLNPGHGNRWVVQGDFHQLQFAKGSVDIVFTNSLDHAINLDAVMGEARRVLCEEGTLIVEAVAGRDEHRPGGWEALSWQHLDDLVGAIEKAGFRLGERFEFWDFWPGTHLRFTTSDRT